MSKTLLVGSRAKGKWTIIALYLIPGCNQKRRTVISMITHINKDHPVDN